MKRYFIIAMIPFIMCCKKLFLQIFERKSKLAIFGASGGKYYLGNSRCMFEWMRFNTDYECIWLTRDAELSDLPENSVRIYSLKALYLLFVAEVAFITHGLTDIAFNPFIVPKDLTLVNLRHGFPVKGYRFARKGSQISEYEKKIRRYEALVTDYVPTISEFVAGCQLKALEIEKKKFFITGFPRNDIFFEKSYQTVRKALIERLKVEFIPRKIILYAPTWRHGRGNTKYFPFDDFDVERWRYFSKKHGLLTLFRPHKQEKKYFKEVNRDVFDWIKKSQHGILYGFETQENINADLAAIDILITDYSGIFHDFLLLNQPILFIPYDFDSFLEHDGFMYDYYKNLPGPALDSFMDFTGQIERILNGKDDNQEKREALCNKY